MYDYTDDNGKRHYESFTAETKTAAELMAAEFANDKTRKAKNDLTIHKAMENSLN